MPHKFKIGDVVNYRPRTACSAQSAAYIVTALKLALDGGPSECRFGHPGEDFERVALENELSAA
jgi:hypothetical protein